MPNISIIVPVYNVETYLHRCVDSILSQSYSDFELILVDDGSPDNCGSICDEYAQKDSRIHVIHQQNSGLSAARNAAIDWVFANSDSQWLAFIDSDDFVHPQFLELLLNAAELHDVPISYCKYIEIPPSTTADPLWLEPLTPKTNVISSEEGYSVSPCNKLYKKSCWKSIRFPIGKLHEDAFTIYKVIFEYPMIASVDAPLYLYQVNNGSITHSPWTPKRLEEFEAFEEQLDYLQGRNMENQFCKTVRIYLYRLEERLATLQQDTRPVKHKSYYVRVMRKMMRKLIRKYRKRANISIAKHAFLFEASYPRLMYVYWTIRGLQHKFKKN